MNLVPSVTVAGGLLLLQLHNKLFVDAFYNPAFPALHVWRPVLPNGALAASSPVGKNVVFDAPNDLSSSTDDGKEANKKRPRPLFQNWWPVTMSTALDPSKPNPVELLDKKLVLWRDRNDESSSWSCLDDQCAHRFAPLSEGRVVPAGEEGIRKKNCLQCAYHGWEFNSKGGCTRIPQRQSTSSFTPEQTTPIRSYPVREAAGMIWVWSDPDPSTNDLAESIPLPISSFLNRFTQAGWASRGFMRDLPYGMELLGENLVDVSHLPFSHHSVGNLNRADGRPVPLKMLSEPEREETAESQEGPTLGSRLPLFQAKVIDAASHDPEVVAALKNPAVKMKSSPDLATSTIGFFDPCHVRYYRNPGVPGSSYTIELFMCPKSGGKSRVFLFTPFESRLPPLPVKPEEGASSKGGNAVDEDKTKDNSEQKKYEPSFVMQRTAAKLFEKKASTAAFPPHVGHMIAHSIFDGDGIFLHKQGDRMSRSGLTYRDYHTPTSSDALVNAYRRWLDSAASVTRDVGGSDGQRAAMAATGSNVLDSAMTHKGNAVPPVQKAAPTAVAYRDDLARSDMLDRYKTHTAHCNICLTALKGFERKRDKVHMATTALVGAAGASGALTATTAVLLVVARLCGRAAVSGAVPVMLSSALAMMVSVIGARRVMMEGEKVEKEIKRFYFEDYVHAEKD